MMLNLVIAAVGVYAWLSKEENNQRERYYNSSRRLDRETKARQRELDTLRQNRALATDFYRHIQLHYAAVQTANACYEVYEQHKAMVKMLTDRKQVLCEQIIRLKQQREGLSYTARQPVQMQLNQVRTHFVQAKEELAQLLVENRTLREKVRLCNAQTRELKDYIGKNCGQKGRDWYNKPRLK